jgi:transposase-like protein
LFLERGVEVDHSTLNRWVLAYAPLIRTEPQCGLRNWRSRFSISGA